jgi:Ca2+/H+ antiporter, TMEM165/GDT1 family
VTADLLTAFGLVFLAEFGDKTMLATLALAGGQAPLPTWLGAGAGMTAASGIAIVLAVLAGARLPERALHLVAAGAFLLFGVLLLASGLTG